MPSLRLLTVLMLLALFVTACTSTPDAPPATGENDQRSTELNIPTEETAEDEEEVTEEEIPEDEEEFTEEEIPEDEEEFTEEEPAVGEAGSWLIMLYANADDEILEEDIFIDVNEAERVGSTDMVQIVAQLDRFDGAFDGDGDWTSTKRFFLTQDDDLMAIGSEELEDLGETNMADGQTLVDFAVWGITNYPADHYVLILSDHGMGWPGGWNDPAPGGPGPDGLPLTEAGDLLLLSEMDAAMDLIIAETEIEGFEIIGFDACLMGHIEVVAAMQPYANYVIASQELEPAVGWAYHSFLTSLNEDPGMGGAGLSQAIVDSYIVEDQRILDDEARAAFDDDISPDELAQVLGGDITLSAVDTAAMPDLLAALDALAVALVAEDQSLVAEARAYTQSFANVFDPDLPEPYIDLGHFAAVLAELSENADVDTAAEELFAAIEMAVIAEKHGENRPGATGISIYYPDSNLYDSVIGGYDIYPAVSNSFAESSLWSGFLDYHYYNVPLEGVTEDGVDRSTVVAPGASDLTLDPLTVSVDTITVNESLVLTTRVTGENIGFIYSFLGYYDPESDTILVADEDFLLADDTREINGIFYPDWGDTGEVPIEYEWEPVVYGISDGTTIEFALFQPEDYGAPDEDFTYAVEGTYTFASGASRYAVLYFSEDELQSVYGFTNADGSGAPREIIPEPGDTFTILDQYYQLSADSDEAEPVSADGATLTFGDQPFTLETLEALPGDYVLGIIVEDLDGNFYEEYIDVSVTE